MDNLAEKVKVVVCGRQPSTNYIYKTTILKETAKLSDQIVSDNTKYVVKWNFILDNDIIMPENCILEFDGGSITCDEDFKITGNETIVLYNYNLEDVFPKEVRDGSWKDSHHGSGSEGIILNGENELNLPDTVYVFQQEIDLGDSTVIIPDGCTLKFSGGSIDNGILVGNNTLIDARLTQIFGPNLILQGTWKVVQAYPEWFGAESDGTTDDTEAIQKTINAFNEVKLTGTYLISTVRIPKGHKIENSTTYVLDGNGYELEMKSVLTGGIIEVNNSVDYIIDGKQLKHPEWQGETLVDSYIDTTVIGGQEYYYEEVQLSPNETIKVIKGQLAIYENSEWKISDAFYKTSNGTIVKILSKARGDSYYQKANSYVELDYEDLGNVPAAVTLIDDYNRRIIVENIKITVGDLYDSENRHFAGGAKDKYICCGIKTITGRDKYNAFGVYSSINIYGLFYGINGNIRASQFDVTLEQCYDNFDIYGDLNIINIKGQSGYLLNLNPNDEDNPEYLFNYFMYIEGNSNVINDGIYDIGSVKSKGPVHQYLIKQKSSNNVINSRRITNYNNVVSNNKNGDLLAGTYYGWFKGHKHDYCLKNLQYTATIENSLYNNIDQYNLFEATDLFIYPSGNKDSSGTYDNTLKLTITIEGIYNLFGVTSFFMSNGSTFKSMKVYYGSNIGTTKEEEDLKANIHRASTPYLDWNASNVEYRSKKAQTLKLVFESDQEVRWFGLRVYGKTTQDLTQGKIYPTQNLQIGQQFFDTNTNSLFIWDGHSWISSSSVIIPKQMIQYLDPDPDYKRVTLTSQQVNVDCYPDGRFKILGGPVPKGSAGGRLNKLSKVITLQPGTYTVNRSIIRDTQQENDKSSVEGLSIYLINTHNTSSIQDDDTVTNFNVDSKTITILETTECYIGINFNSLQSYDCEIKLSVIDVTPQGLGDVLTSVVNRLNTLENKIN